VSHTSRILFNGLPRFLPPFGLQFFGTLGNRLPVIFFVCCNQFLLYSCILDKPEVIFNSFAISVLLYNLPKCVLLFFLHVSFLLLLFFLRILLQLSNFQYRIKRLDWFYIMTVCNIIRSSTCSHYINFSSVFLLSYTQPDACWFIAEIRVSTCSCVLYNYSDNLCSSSKVYGIFFKLNIVLIYKTRKCKWICELIQSSGTDLSTQLW